MVYYHPREIYNRIREAGRSRPSVLLVRNLEDPNYLRNLISAAKLVPDHLRDDDFDRTVFNLEFMVKAKTKVFGKK